MALNDLSFSSHRGAPWGAAIFFVLAAVLIGLAVANGVPGPAYGAFLPGAIALALWVTQQHEIEGRVAEDGIVLRRPPMIIPFESIRGVEVPVKSSGPALVSFPIKVHHNGGILTIPDAPDIASRAIHEALTSRVAEGGSRAVHPELTAYVQRHESNFGPERVWTFCAAPRPAGDVHRPRRLMAVGLATLATSIAWFIIAASTHAPGGDNVWWGLTALAMIFGVALSIIGASLGRPPRVLGLKNWQASSLVVTPVGLALIQGDVQGELFWDQLRDVKFKEKATSFRLSSEPNLYGITLVVEGARILIPDFYDRPLPLIHEKIVRYWKPERVGMSADF
jgi:hypothetical protein